jgi:hypothetical protein
MKNFIFTTLFALSITGQMFSQQSDTITLNLLNPTYPETFVYTSDGYWDQTFNDEDYMFFTSQVFSFSHLIEGKGAAYGGYAWNGFTVCNNGDNTNYSYTGSWMNYQWGCMAGGGIKTDEQGNILKDINGVPFVEKGLPYMVGFWNNLIEPEWWHYGYGGIFLDEPTRCLQILLDDEDEYEAVGVYVNMHPYTYYANRDGFGVARPLQQEGDYYKLIFHGYNTDGSESGKSVEYYMSKFEDGQFYQSDKWEWVDLSSLGVIGGFYCTIVSTDSNYLGPKSPVYFCMDKLKVRTKEELIHISVTDLAKIEIYSFQNSVYIKNLETWRVASPNRVEIFDFTGRLVYKGTINNAETVVTLHVPNGIYSVILSNVENGFRVSKKVMINN